MKFMQWLSLAAIAPVIVSCSNADRKPQSAIYLAIATNSPEMTSFAQDILSQVSRGTRSDQWMIVDLLRNEAIENVFSHSPTRVAIQEIMVDLKQTPSDDRALIQAFRRLTKLAIEHQGKKRFYGYVVTEGTQDPNTLKKIRALFDKIAQQPPADMQIYVVGLAPENRLKMSAALEPVSDRVQFAGTSDREWTQLIRQF